MRTLTFFHIVVSPLVQFIEINCSASEFSLKIPIRLEDCMQISQAKVHIIPNLQSVLALSSVRHHAGDIGFVAVGVVDDVAVVQFPDVAVELLQEAPVVRGGDDGAGEYI